MIYLVSPLIYNGFYRFCNNFVKPFFENSRIQKSKNSEVLVEKIKNTHNFSLGLFSSVLSILSFSQIYSFIDFSDPVCQIYPETSIMSFIVLGFYLSKYWEWLDTAFLIIKNKKVSYLHYCHHSSTAFLSYMNTYYAGITPSYIYAVFLNTTVHFYMYFYYLSPNGILKKYKKWITVFQIFQHLYMIFSTFYIGKNCLDRIDMNVFVSTLCCYSFYLFAFLNFYLKTY